MPYSSQVPTLIDRLRDRAFWEDKEVWIAMVRYSSPNRAFQRILQRFHPVEHESFKETHGGE
ncbi:MAG: hypothetical protein GVY04_23365 [Cyanobacteria bacterium]|nr:hypothetical protein [Cyanobacteria bacterium GSL.Bin1]